VAKTYTFVVVAQNSFGLLSEPSSIQITYYGIPAAPVIPMIAEANIKHSSATFSWEAPANTGGAQVLNYFVYFRQSNDLQAAYEQLETTKT